MIKNIIFDLSEVLLTGFKNVEYLIAPKIGEPTSEVEKKLHAPVLTDLFNGQITEQKYWELIKIENNWNLSIRELKEIIRKSFAEIPNTRQIILNLKKYNLGLLSVHCREWIDYCQKKFKYQELFITCVYSFVTGVSKPYEKSYQIILEKMQAKPSETLFIDDSLPNVETARNLGMKAIQFCNSQQLEIELKEMGIL